MFTAKQAAERTYIAIEKMMEERILQAAKGGKNFIVLEHFEYCRLSDDEFKACLLNLQTLGYVLKEDFANNSIILSWSPLSEE